MNRKLIGEAIYIRFMIENKIRKPRNVEMCWPRVGEANPLFSIYSTLCRWTATNNFINAVKRKRNLGIGRLMIGCNCVLPCVVISFHILLFITTNIWLQHNLAYPRNGHHIYTEILVVRRIIHISDAGEVLFCYGFLTRDVKSWIETVFIGCKNTRSVDYILFLPEKSPIGKIKQTD